MSSSIFKLTSTSGKVKTLAGVFLLLLCIVPQTSVAIQESSPENTNQINPDDYLRCQAKFFNISKDGQYAYSLYKPSGTSRADLTIFSLDDQNELPETVTLKGFSKSNTAVKVSIKSDNIALPYENDRILIMRNKGVSIYSLGQKKIVKHIKGLNTNGIISKNQKLIQKGWYVKSTPLSPDKSPFQPAPLKQFFNKAPYQYMNIKTGDAWLETKDDAMVNLYYVSSQGQIFARTISSKDSNGQILQFRDDKNEWKDFLSFSQNNYIFPYFPDSFDNETMGEFYYIQKKHETDNDTKAETVTYAIVWANSLTDVKQKILRTKKKLNHVQFSAEGEEVLWAELNNQGTYENIYFDHNWRQKYTSLNPESTNRTRLLHFDKTGSKAVVETKDSDGGVRYAVYDISGKKPVEIRELCQQVTAKRPAAQQIKVTAQDGFQSHVIYLGPKKPEKGYILYIHGGPRSHSSPHYSATYAFLSDLGYGILSVNYRGSTGYGEEYIRASDHNYKGMVYDVLAAADWLINNRAQKPIYLLGASFGSLIAQSSIIAAPDKFSGFISISGLSDITNKDIYRATMFANKPVQQLKEIFTKDLPDISQLDETTKALLPPLNAREIKIPTLYIHGEKDRNAPIFHSEKMVKLLKENDQKTELYVIPNAAHSLECHQCREMMMRKIQDFLP
ncbi:alpha/beta hydrolase family protein [Paremcibacter congregatus]|uniref:alpha/beta hydrolase family protein n=1 Tax=Paremcibacter congregatus TaxID=2043170 RepID=UPI003A93DC4F